MKFVLAVLAMVLLTGCLTQAALTVNSQPPGAFIVEKGSGRALGIAPVNSFYDGTALQPYKDATGCHHVPGFDATWVSGARATTEDTVTLCGPAAGRHQITVSRNPSDPGLDNDLQFARRMQSIGTQGQQAQAAEAVAAAALYRVFGF